MCLLDDRRLRSFKSAEDMDKGQVTFVSEAGCMHTRVSQQVCVSGSCMHVTLPKRHTMGMKGTRLEKIGMRSSLCSLGRKRAHPYLQPWSKEVLVDVDTVAVYRKGGGGA